MPAVLTAGIAFGANTNENTIVALIIALCFHVGCPSPCAPCTYVRCLGCMQQQWQF